MMVAMSSASVVPAIERWGVLVTNLGATVVTVLGALYVLILFSLSNRCSPLEIFFPPWLRCSHTHRGALMKHPEYNTVLMTPNLATTEPYGQRSASEKSYVLMLTLGIPQLPMCE